MKYPIYIPSNNPPTKVVKHLKDECFVVNDENLFGEDYNFLQSPTFNCNHLPNKRQWILEHAIEHGFEFFWTMDDDFMSLYQNDFKTRKSRTVGHDGLLEALEDSESLVSTERHGFLTFRSRLFWYQHPIIHEELGIGSPLILWNTNALIQTQKKFNDVFVEEDVYMMMCLINDGWYPLNWGKYTAQFHYEDKIIPDEYKKQWFQAVPKKTAKLIKAPWRVKETHRRLLPNGQFISLAKTPDRLYKDSNVDLDEFF